MKALRLLMTTDAVGGVWRYAVDLARGLDEVGVETILLGFGPRPTLAQRLEAERHAEVVWTELPLDWMVPDAGDLAAVPAAIAAEAERTRADIIHVNLPSQAAELDTNAVVVAAAHSCVTSWFRVVRGTELPASWAWQRELTRRGLARADRIVAPSRAFARLLFQCYPGVGPVSVVPNATALRPLEKRRQSYAYAAARWWDEGKDAHTLDAAAARCRRPVHVAGAIVGPDGQQVRFDHARHVGQLDAASLVNLARSATAFVSPSRYEPFGLAALEAAAVGAALVLSDIPTYRELWDGAALFVGPGDASGFAAALDRLEADRDLCRRLAKEATRRAATLTPRRQAGLMLAQYLDAMPRPQAIGA